MARELSEAQVATSARHGRLRRSISWLNASKVLLTMVIVVAVSGISVAAYAALGLVSSVETVELTVDPDAVGAGTQSLDGALTILLVGSDSRKGQSIDDGEESELADVNLLLHIPADHQSATVMSFPRDLMVPIPSCAKEDGSGSYPAMSEQMLNSSMMYGGLPCVADTISNLTGMEIPYAAMVTFDGVIAVSNAIGGVTVCLSQPINDPYTGLDLPAGDVTLQGYEALQFLRTRHGVGDGGDVSRISNQQVFMSALVRDLQSSDTLSNPIKVYGLAKAGVENMTLSSNMATVQFMQQLAGTVVGMDLSRINFVQYPTYAHPYQEGRLTPDRSAAETLIDVVLSGEPFVVSGLGTAAVAPPTDEPATETPAPETPATPGDPAATPDQVAPPVELPNNITGQSAAAQTCSAGRTVF